MVESTSNSTIPGVLRTSALAGGAVAVVLLVGGNVGLVQLGIIEILMILAPLVVVPLGISVAVPEPKDGLELAVLRTTVYLQPVGALLVVVSFFLPVGLPAASAAAIWLIVTLGLAGFSIIRTLRLGVLPIEELSLNAGLLYISVGGIWLMMSRMGLQPAGFGETIVLLTAVHFHYAGFATPVLASLSGRLLTRRNSGPRRLYGLCVLSLIASMPLIATGITVSPVVALTGTIVLAIGISILAIINVLIVVRRFGPLPAQALLLLSSVSALLAVTLAILYAYQLVAKSLIIEIPEMARWHGTTNALGFILAGLIAWLIADAKNGI